MHHACGRGTGRNHTGYESQAYRAGGPRCYCARLRRLGVASPQTPSRCSEVFGEQFLLGKEIIEHLNHTRSISVIVYLKWGCM
jgi:hypothetical protein